MYFFFNVNSNIKPFSNTTGKDKEISKRKMRRLHL